VTGVACPYAPAPSPGHYRDFACGGPCSDQFSDSRTGWPGNVLSCCCPTVPRDRRRQVDRSKDSLFFPTGQSLAYLDGSLPADFGFDPLGLLDPESKGVGFINPEWLRYACALLPSLGLTPRAQIPGTPCTYPVTAACKARSKPSKNMILAAHAGI